MRLLPVLTASLMSVPWVCLAEDEVLPPPAEEVSVVAMQPVPLPPLPTGEPLTSPAFYDLAPVPFAVREYREPGLPIYPAHLLPPPQDPNDLQTHTSPGVFSTRALAVGTTDSGASAPSLQLGLQLRPGIWYDTGFVGSERVFNPATIAVDGSDDAHKRGQIFYDAAEFQNFVLPYRPQIGAQAGSDTVGSVQAHADMFSPNGSDLEFRSAYARYLNTSEEFGVVFGTIETLFGDLGSVPKTVGSGALPVGVVTASSRLNSFVGVPQLRVGTYWHNFTRENDVLEWAVSAEKPDALNLPDNADYPILPPPLAVTPLQRYPTFVSRLRYQGGNGFDSYQVAGLVHPFGYERNLNSHEVFETGYGASISARKRLGGCPDSDFVMFGAAAGRGIAGYVYGETQGVEALPATEQLQLYTTVGVYASYGHIWTILDNGHWWSSNAMYGYVQGDDDAPADTNRQLQQFGVNLLWNNTGSSSAGLEYQYGYRELVSGMSGDDHRIMLVFQVGLTPAFAKDTGVYQPPSAAAEARGVAAAARGMASPMAPMAPSAPAPSAPVSTKSSLRL